MVGNTGKPIKTKGNNEFDWLTGAPTPDITARCWPAAD